MRVIVAFDRPGFEERVHQLCRLWAEEASKGNNIFGASTKLAKDVVRIVYESRVK